MNRSKREYINKTTIIIVTLFVTYFINPIFFKNNVTCVCKGVTGIPCPACGMTRSTMAFLRGDWEYAFRMHPATFMLPIFAALWVYYYKKENSKRKNQILVLFIIILVIIWIVRMLLFFPNNEPLDYYEYSIIERIKEIFN